MRARATPAGIMRLLYSKMVYQAIAPASGHNMAVSTANTSWRLCVPNMSRGVRSRSGRRATTRAASTAASCPVSACMPLCARAAVVGSKRRGTRQRSRFGYTFNGHNLRYCHAERSISASNQRFFASLSMTDTARWQYIYALGRVRGRDVNGVACGLPGDHRRGRRIEREGHHSRNLKTSIARFWGRRLHQRLSCTEVQAENRGRV